MFKKVIFEERTNFKAMLSLLFIYFLGKPFYILAGKHKQNEWLYAILGVLSYYVATFIFAFILIGLELLFSLGIDHYSDRIFGIITIPFGLLGCWGFYKLLEHKWKKMIQVEIETIDEIGRNQSQE